MRVVGEDLERQRVECVARQHRGRFVERLVDGRLAAPHVVIVHAWQVVVDQAVDVDCLDRGADPQRALPVDMEQVARRDDKQRAQPFAAADRGMAHCLDQSGAGIVGNGQDRVEMRVDRIGDLRHRGGEDRPGVVGGVGIFLIGHRSAQSASNGWVPVAWPPAPVVIFSIRTCAAASRASQCFLSASPRE